MICEEMVYVVSGTWYEKSRLPVSIPAVIPRIQKIIVGKDLGERGGGQDGMWQDKTHRMDKSE